MKYTRKKKLYRYTYMHFTDDFLNGPCLMYKEESDSCLIHKFATERGRYSFSENRYNNLAALLRQCLKGFLFN